MLKKLFNALALFAFLSLACYVVFLLYNKNSTITYIIKPYHVANGNNAAFWKIEKYEIETEATNVSQEKTQTTTTTTTRKPLDPCPDNPPNLIGPLAVDFNYTLNLDRVRTDVSSSLQDGGRYKPPDCIAKQKVGE